MKTKYRCDWRKFFGCAAGVAAMAIVLCPLKVLAETRGYVVSYLHVANHHAEGNCPDGDNGDFGTIKARAYKLRGLSQKQIDELNSGKVNPLGGEVSDVVTYRGTRNGKPANVFHYPLSQPDPHLKRVVGTSAYGFNLDGKGADDPGSFIDPETGEKGVDNELFRLLGCSRGYTDDLPVRPYFEGEQFRVLAIEMPAWLISVSGEDLSRDGEVTVSIHRAIGRRLTNATGETLFHASYVIDNNSPTRGTFRGELKNGEFRSYPDQDVSIFWEGELSFFTKFELRRAQLRFNIGDDGSLAGYMGGYHIWEDYWVGLQDNGEISSNIDTAGLYRGMHDLAEAYPDPETGQNQAISATFRIDAAPAFLANSDGKFITAAN